jgi:hypothetical protein
LWTHDAGLLQFINLFACHLPRHILFRLLFRALDLLKETLGCLVVACGPLLLTNLLKGHGQQPWRLPVRYHHLGLLLVPDQRGSLAQVLLLRKDRYILIIDAVLRSENRRVHTVLALGHLVLQCMVCARVRGELDLPSAFGGRVHVFFFGVLEHHLLLDQWLLLIKLTGLLIK